MRHTLIIRRFTNSWLFDNKYVIENKIMTIKSHDLQYSCKIKSYLFQMLCILISFYYRIIIII